MKKIFTLIAGLLLVCGSVSAQKKWTNVVVNGDFEAEVPSYTTLDEMEEGGVLIEEKSWNSFWSHEFPQNEIGEEQYQGTATIVEDALLPGNHCARVVARSEAIADSCGNKVANNGALASWDCQFFIYSTEPIPQGKLVRLTIRVRAEKAGKFETQAHWAPGDYNHYVMFGDVNVTTDWQTIVTDEVTVSADQSKEGDGKAFQSVAFNLSTDATGNVFYFDDIKLEIKDDGTGEEDPEKPAEWVNFLRKGTLSEDIISGSTTNFTGRDGADGSDVKARIVNDPLDGEPALNVTTIGWNTVEVLKDSLGNDSIDEATGEPALAYYYIKENGDTLKKQDGSYGIDDWQTQFFVTIKHKFKANQKYKFVMSARAARLDGEPLEGTISLDTQAHNMPGGYVHWAFLGSPELTDEWQDFEFGSEDDPMTIASEANGCQTIAFNCNKTKDFPVNLYFRIKEFSFMSNVVLDNERVLASEDVKLPISATNEAVTVGTIDMTEALKTLEIEDFAKFLEKDGSVKMKYIDSETEDEAYGNVDMSAGAFIDANGNWTDKEVDGIILEPNEENTKDSTLGLDITNAGLSADAIAKGISSKIVFENNFWRYLYNVTFVDEEVLGISEVKTAPKANVIYDLMGRKVSKANKGLYIVAGKKVLFK